MSLLIPAKPLHAPASLAGLADHAVRELATRSLRGLVPAVPGLLAPRISGLAHPFRGIRKGSADEAQKLYRGVFHLSGHTLTTAGTSVFAISDGAPAPWLEELHAQTWLAHLHCAGSELHRVFARGQISDWLEHRCWQLAAARQTRTLSRRIMSWIEAAPFLLHKCDRRFETAFLSSLARQIRRLDRQGPLDRTALVRLESAMTLSTASVCLEGLEPLRRSALARLAGELEAQILPDGGHVSRHPGVLLDLLCQLMPLREVFKRMRIELPHPVSSATERMLPMLRLLCHGDDGLALFHGVGDTAAGRVRAVFALDDTQGKPLAHARHSGFCRLSHGHSVAILDAGPPVAPGLNAMSSASALALEFSDGAHRVITNCGSPGGGGESWKGPARLTSAHSTVMLGERDSARVLDADIVHRLFGTPALIGPRDVTADVSSVPEGSGVLASHDGYVRCFGRLHERSVFLSRDGHDLRGEDRFTPAVDDAPEQDFAIRFHLHPSVKATVSRDGASVMLVLPNKTGWRFSARGGRLALEESVHLAGRTNPRRSQQIVIKGVTGRPDRVNWALKRIRKKQKPDRPATAADASPRLPL